MSDELRTKIAGLISLVDVEVTQDIAGRKYLYIRNRDELAARILALLSPPLGGGKQDFSSSSPAVAAAPDGATEAQRALDLVWRSIDALGGVHSPEDRESGFADAYDNALNAACAAVEALGGRPN